MEWPELPTHGHDEFTVWYEKVTRRFFDEVHTIKSVEPTIDDDGQRADVKVVVNWGAHVWEPPAAKSIYLHMDAFQTWEVVRDAGERQGPHPQIPGRLVRAEPGLGRRARPRSARHADRLLPHGQRRRLAGVAHALPGGRRHRRAARRPRRGARHPARRDRRHGEGLLALPERAEGDGRPGQQRRRRIAHLGRQRCRRGDRGGGGPTTSSSATGRSPTWRTSTTRGPSIPSSTRSWTERRCSTYNFIVVFTTGSAGSARGDAALERISDVNVLALEAGGEPYPENVTNPALWYTLFGTPVDWGYLSVPQKALGGRPSLSSPGGRCRAGRATSTS